MTTTRQRLSFVALNYTPSLLSRAAMHSPRRNRDSTDSRTIRSELAGSNHTPVTLSLAAVHSACRSRDSAKPHDFGRMVREGCTDIFSGPSRGDEIERKPHKNGTHATVGDLSGSSHEELYPCPVSRLDDKCRAGRHTAHVRLRSQSEVSVL